MTKKTPQIDGLVTSHSHEINYSNVKQFQRIENEAHSPNYFMMLVPS